MENQESSNNGGVVVFLIALFIACGCATFPAGLIVAVIGILIALAVDKMGS